MSDSQLKYYTKFLISSFRWYWRSNLGVFIGTAIATAVLAGALIVGDSVRQSLVNISMKRLGKTSFAMETGKKFQTAGLSRKIQELSGISTTGILHLPGVLLDPGRQEQLTGVQVYGIDHEFWQFAVESKFSLRLAAGEVAINDRVAALLGLTIGDHILLRLEQPNDYFVDTPLASNEQQIKAIPVIIKHILQAEQLGRFGLENNQLYPRNLFIGRQFLTQKLDVPDRTNIILAQDNLPDASKKLVQALSTSLTLEDLGLKLQRESGAGILELISSSIFIPERTVSAINSTIPGSEGIFTYFVNSITTGTQLTPYSFIAGIERYESRQMAMDEIIISNWLAQDMGIQIGDQLKLSYFTIGTDNNLVEDSAFFSVSSIIAANTEHLNRSLTPFFPGLGDAKTCFEWSPGIPVDLGQVRPQDEKYWEEFNSTPKALISLSTAQQLWSNRFGSLTALRFPDDIDPESLTQTILKNIDPTLSYMQFQPVRADAIKASINSVDFGQLFIGLSFFIILGAVLLIGLLFRYSAEQRQVESNQLLALGFKLRQVKILHSIEAGIIALAGSIVGLGLGILYARGLLHGLGKYWRSAVGFSDFQLAILPSKLLISSLVGTILALAVIWSSLRKLREKRNILEDGIASLKPIAFRHIKWSLSGIILGLVIIAVFWFTPDVTENLSIFYLAGMLLLAWFTGLVLLIAHEFSLKISKGKFNIRQLWIGNWYRRRGKNLTIILMLALGIFVVILVGANYTDSTRDGHLKLSGTGGFNYYLETSINYPDQLELTEPNDGVVVSLRKLAGDDASCLNLNLINQPQVLGVNPVELSGRFSFAQTGPDYDLKSPWKLLSTEFAPDIIPAIADQTVLQWGLMKGIGDTLFYLDDNGQRVGLLIVGSLKNSIFQGNLIISESNFVDHFTTSGGYRVFLIDILDETFSLSKMSRKLSSYGPDIMLTIERLNEFSAVENTYLLIFLLLGGLGLLISTFGLSTTVIRSVLSNRWELALFQAVGFRRRTVIIIIGSEHIFNLFAGILIGGLPALLATWPILVEQNSQFPLGLIGLIMLGIIVNGLLWTWIGVKMSLKDDFISVLSKEN